MAIRQTHLNSSVLCVAILLANCLATTLLAQPAASPALKSTTKPSSPTEARESWNSPEYIDWLERQSMLKQSTEIAPSVSGKGTQWQRPYAEPQPRTFIRQSSVWLLAYPGSVITRPGESVMASWGDPKLW